MTRSKARERRGDPASSSARDRLRVEEAAGVVELDAAAPAGSAARARADLRAGSRRAAPVSGSVFCQRSHITQRHGHSRLVRKTVATGDDLARLGRLVLDEGARRARRGSSARRAAAALENAAVAVAGRRTG